MVKGSAWANVWRVLVNPAQGMAAVAESLALWPGYLVQMAAMLVTMALLMDKTLAESMDKLAAAGIPPEAMGVAKLTGVITSLVMALAMPWVGGLMTGLVLRVIGLFHGSTATFRSYMALCGYARIPSVLGSVLAAVLALPASTIQEANRVSVSLAALAPNATGFARAFLSSLNPFELWSLALIVIGYAAVNRFKPAKGMAVGIVLYLITLALSFGGASLTGRA